jgi:hypothetical protein
MLARYAKLADMAHPVSPHRLRHFLFTWLKTQGIDDALIQPYSGHAVNGQFTRPTGGQVKRPTPGVSWGTTSFLPRAGRRDEPRGEPVGEPQG